MSARKLPGRVRACCCPCPAGLKRVCKRCRIRHDEKSFEADCNMDLFLLLFSLICFFICCSANTWAVTSQNNYSDALGADTSWCQQHIVHGVLAQCSRRTHRKKRATKWCFLNSVFLLHSPTLNRLVKASCNLAKNQVRQQIRLQDFTYHQNT